MKEVFVAAAAILATVGALTLGSYVFWRALGKQVGEARQPKPAMAAPPPSPCLVAPPPADGRGFLDARWAGERLFIASADGSLHVLDGASHDIVFPEGKGAGALLGLAVSADGRRIAAVGIDRFLLSDDGGKTFLPVPGGVRAFAVAFVGEEVLVLDLDGKSHRRTPDGRVYVNETPSRATFFSLSFADEQRGYAVGACGTFLETENGGASWTALISPDPSPQGVLVKGETLLLSGENGIYRSIDRGRTFEHVLQGAGNCARLSGRGTEIVAACSQMGRALWRSTDDGRTFHPIAVADAANLHAAETLPDGGIVAVGANEMLVVASPDGGRVVPHSEHLRGWLELVRGPSARDAGGM